MAATLQSIYDRLHGADPYHPYSATTFQDWATEAGDILTINRGEDGYVVPVHSAHLSWRGSPQVVLNGTGNKKRESVEKAAQRKYSRGGSGYRASQVLFHEFTDEDGLLRSSLMMTASELRTEFQASNSAVYSVISQTASEIRTEVGNAESGIYSSISETASQIRSEVANVNSNIRSVINQTASSILLEVGKSAHVYHQYGDPASTEDVKDKDIWIKDAGVQNHGKAATFTHGELGSFKLADFYGSEIYVRENGSWVRVGGDQLQEYNYAQIKVEQDRIAIITDGMSGDYAEFIVELGRIHSEVEDVQEGLASAIEQTASMIRTAVWTANSEMYSEILQTQSMIRSEVANSESGIRSTITQTASGLQIQISRKRAVYLQPTDPSLTNTMYNGDIWIVDNNIYSHAAMAALTHATLGTYALYDYMGKMSWVWKGGSWIPFYDERAKTKDETIIDINERRLTTLYGDVNDKYSQFLQEKTQIRSIVEDKTNALGSEILQTASEIRTSVWAANSQIYSTISQTASEIKSTVTNKTSSLQSQISQQADKISLVVEGTGANAHIKPAAIVAAINAQTGQSAVKISADMIVLDGDAVAASLLGKSIAANFLGCDDLQVTAEIDVDQDAEWKMAMGLTTNIGNTIVKAEVNETTNTLTLTALDGTETTFSKATSLNGEWSGTVAAGKSYKVTASPQGTVHYSPQLDGIIYRNDKTWASDKKSFTQTIYVYDEDGEDLYEENLTFYTTDSYNAGYDANHSMFIGDYDTVAIPSSYQLSLGESIEVWPYFQKKDGEYQWGPKYTFSAPTNPHPTRYRLRCTEATPAYPGGNVKNYTFTIQGVYSFSADTNYDFYM